VQDRACNKTTSRQEPGGRAHPVACVDCYC
jgi:hypothetical protein